MPYSIETQDGIQINNIPDNIAKDSDELKQRVAGLRAERDGVAVPEIAAPQPEVAAPPPLASELSSNIDELDSSIKERQQRTSETFEDVASGEIGVPRAAVNVLGETAGGAFDLLGAGISSALDLTDVAATAVAPEATRSAKDFTKETFGAAATYIKNSTAGKAGLEALAGGVEEYEEWKGENPQNAKTFEAFINIPLLLTPVKGKFPRIKDNNKLSVLQKIAKASKSSAQKTIDAVSKKRATKAVLAIKPDASDLEHTRTLGFRTTKQVPSKGEAMVADEVAKLKLFKNESDGEIFQKISKSIGTKGKSLSDDLKASKVTISDDAFDKALDTAIVDLEKLQLGLGAPAIKPIVGQVKTVAKEIYSKHPNSPIGVLDARKELDNWLELTGLEKVLVRDAPQTAQVESVRAIRRAMNQVVIDAVPSAKVKARLESQSLLYRAKDVLSDKAPNEARNSIGALVKSLKDTTDISIPVTPVGLSLLASTGAATLGGGVGLTALAAGISFAGGKTLMSPKTRLGLARLVSGADKALKLGAKGANMTKDQLKALRVHRAAVIQLIEDSEIDESLGTEEQQ